MLKKLGFYAGSVLFMTFVWSLPAQAQNAIKMTQSNNKESIFYLIDTPSVTFEEDAIIVVAKENKVTIDIEGGISFEFVTVDLASVDTIVTDIPTFKVNQNYIEALGLSPQAQIVISDLTGKNLYTSKADSEGHLFIEITEYQPGVYVFSSKDKKFKFYKK